MESIHHFRGVHLFSSEQAAAFPRNLPLKSTTHYPVSGWIYCRVQSRICGLVIKLAVATGKICFQSQKLHCAAPNLFISVLLVSMQRLCIASICAAHPKCMHLVQEAALNQCVNRKSQQPSFPHRGFLCSRLVAPLPQHHWMESKWKLKGER